MLDISRSKEPPGALRVIPADRRRQIKEKGDTLAETVASWNKIEGVEDEFFYRMPGELRQEAAVFERQMTEWSSERAFGVGETSMVCSAFRKARKEADLRGFEELCSWLYSREQKWKVRMLRKDGAIGKASVLWLVGASTGYGLSVGRWLASLGGVIVVFALLNGRALKYQGAPADFGHSLYWSLVTVSTLGYGDVLPSDFSSMMLAGAEALSGIVL